MSLDTTGQVIIALKCVAQQAQHARGRISKIESSIESASDYLKMQTKHSMNSLWIGNKYSTPIALSALRVVNGNLPKNKER